MSAPERDSELVRNFYRTRRGNTLLQDIWSGRCDPRSSYCASSCKSQLELDGSRRWHCSPSTGIRGEANNIQSIRNISMMSSTGPRARSSTFNAVNLRGMVYRYDLGGGDRHQYAPAGAALGATHMSASMACSSRTCRSPRVEDYACGVVLQ